MAGNQEIGYGPQNPLFLHSADHSNLVLAADLLTEHNYQTWSRTMLNAFQAKDKLVFINGDFLRSDQEHEDFKQWGKVNATLVSWILNSMSRELASGFAYASDAFTLWQEIKDQLGGCIGPRLYEIRKAIYSTKQGKDSVAVYYNKMKVLWEELFCIKPGMRFGDYEEEKMMLFLMGLNDEFSNTRGQILLYKPLPNLSEAYGMVRDLEKQKKLQSAEGVSVSAMQVTNRFGQKGSYQTNQNNKVQFQGQNAFVKPYQTQNYQKEDKSFLKCDFCGKKGHVKRDCFKIKGFPDWWPGAKDQRKGICCTRNE